MGEFCHYELSDRQLSFLFIYVAILDSMCMKQQWDPRQVEDEVKILERIKCFGIDF